VVGMQEEQKIVEEFGIVDIPEKEDPRRWEEFVMVVNASEMKGSGRVGVFVTAVDMWPQSVQDFHCQLARLMPVGWI
jgi:hypothetical protein